MENLLAETGRYIESNITIIGIILFILFTLLSIQKKEQQMKKLIFILAIIVTVTIAGDTKQKPEYTYRTVELQKLEDRAKMLQDRKKEAETVLSNIEKEMFVLQGAFAVYSSMPDSFVVRPDSLRAK